MGGKRGVKGARGAGVGQNLYRVMFPRQAELFGVDLVRIGWKTKKFIFNPPPICGVKEGKGGWGGSKFLLGHVS
jgi:hypothetical protein